MGVTWERAKKFNVGPGVLGLTFGCSCGPQAPLRLRNGGGNLQRIGFARHFFDAWEKRAGVFNRADELVFENRCRAPADVHTVKS